MPRSKQDGPNGTKKEDVVASTIAAGNNDDDDDDLISEEKKQETAGDDDGAEDSRASVWLPASPSPFQISDSPADAAAPGVLLPEYKEQVRLGGPNDRQQEPLRPSSGDAIIPSVEGLPVNLLTEQAPVAAAAGNIPAVVMETFGEEGDHNKPRINAKNTVGDPRSDRRRRVVAAALAAGDDDNGRNAPDDSTGDRSVTAAPMVETTGPPTIIGKHLIWAAAFVIAVIVAAAGILVAVVLSIDNPPTTLTTTAPEDSDPTAPPLSLSPTPQTDTTAATPTFSNQTAIVLTASEPFPFDGFGESVAVSGESIAVGAPWGQKAAYVFVKAAGANWTQQAKLVPENTTESQELFGFSVAIDKDTLIVGAPSDTGGSAYLFVHTETTTSWTEQARFANRGEYWFGNRVAIADDTAVVAENTRSYVITRTAASVWLMSATLPLGVFPENGDVAVYNNMIAVCNRFCFDSSEACIALYTGSGSDWTEQTVIRQSGNVTSRFFGKSMAMTEDNKLVVGAWYGPYAYVFQRDEIDPTEWTLQSVLEESSGSTGIFGQSVAISGSTIVVAAFQESGHNYEHAKVHVFEQDSGAASEWTERTIFYSYHGWALAMDGDIVAFASAGGLYSNLTGSVDVFDLSLL